MHITANTMQTFVGTCHALTDRPVAGRIVFGKSDSLFSDAARFLVVSATSNHPLPQSGEGVAGIICVGDAPSSVSDSPPCPLLYLPSLPDSCEGRIALLDPVCGMLFVSPDIGICNRLCPRLSTPALTPVLLPDGRRLRIGSVFSPESASLSSSTESVLLLPDPSVAEEDRLYEQYRDLAEGLVGVPVTVIVPYGSDSDTFRRQIRALFRGSVFGRFFLLLRDIQTRSAWVACQRELRGIDDELTREGREHNGHLPCGILLDAPLLLHVVSLTNADFLCLELDRLWDLLTGYSSHGDRETASLFLRALQGIAAYGSKIPVSVLCHSPDRLALLPDISGAWNVTDCYIPPLLSSRTREIFMKSELQRKKEFFS